MTICKLYGGNFSPSSWVDEFWHHHMSFDTRHYREFCLNVYGEWIEHSEIDYKNLNSSEQSQLMEKDSKFREAYFECFNHEPIECIWPEIISENIEEPDKFVVMNLMKMLITKKIVKDVNVLAIRNQYQAQLEEYKNDHGTFSNIIPNFFNKLIGGKKEKSVKEFQKEIEQKIQVNGLQKF